MNFSLLSGLGESEQREVLSTARRRKFARREVIFHEGDPGEAIHLIDSGHVGIRITTPLGDVAMVRIVGPGDFFGELALLSEGQRSATAVAIGASQTLSITRAQFDDLRRRSPIANEVILTALATEVRRLAAAHVEALFLPADKRVFRRLMEAARSFGPSSTVVIPLTQDEIAQLAGTTRPTANRLLVQAQAAGAIRLLRGQIEVVDLEWIERRAR